MVGLFLGVPYSFGALRKTYGPLFVRCDVCRRYPTAAALGKAGAFLANCCRRQMSDAGTN
jgi:hypothetical protein